MKLSTTLAACAAMSAALAAFSCSTAPGSGVTGGNGNSSGGASTAGAGVAGPGPGSGATGPVLVDLGGGTETSGDCKGLQCQQTSCTAGVCVVPACTPGVSTTVTGKVFDPAGKVPLYNVVVYVPSDAVPAFTDGAACDRCGSSIIKPITSAITDETGTFVLPDAPVGANIPLVLQVGKWRRQITIPNVAACVDTPLTDPQLTRLPRNKAEGDIPKIAIAAGGADAMECLPRRLGIEDAEFSTSAGTGRIHLYGGADDGENRAPKAFDASLNGGIALPRVTELWNSLDTLKKYDIVILSCEGGTVEAEKPPAARKAMYDYASAGGRIFASHWHHIWFSGGPAPLPTTGGWANREDPTAMGAPMPAVIDQSFPKGKALAQWLVNVGATPTLGQMTVTYPRDNIQTVNPTVAREWITIQNPKYSDAPKAVEYMSFNTPLNVPEEQACGRAVFTGLHVSSTSADGGVQPPAFPKDCEERDLSAQEKAVAFMLFDLSSCIQNDDVAPKPPK